MSIFVAIIFGVFLFGTLGGVSLAGMFLPAFQPELRGGVILLVALICGFLAVRFFIILMDLLTKASTQAKKPKNPEQKFNKPE